MSEELKKMMEEYNTMRGKAWMQGEMRELREKIMAVPRPLYLVIEQNIQGKWAHLLTFKTRMTTETDRKEVLKYLKDFQMSALKDGSNWVYAKSEIAAVRINSSDGPIRVYLEYENLDPNIRLESNNKMLVF